MSYPFQLPELGYDYAALEPHIDGRTMEIHHQKHHGGYTAKFNAALEGHPRLHGIPAEQILRGFNGLPSDIQGAVRNNGGGFYNHALFWEIMTPGGPDAPTGDLAVAMSDAFGSFDAFKDQFASAAANRFGSGWAWLVVDPFGKLQVLSTANQDSPLPELSKPPAGLHPGVLERGQLGQGRRKVRAGAGRLDQARLNHSWAGDMRGGLRKGPSLLFFRYSCDVRGDEGDRSREPFQLHLSESGPP